jgi:hypothetical protein
MIVFGSILTQYRTKCHFTSVAHLGASPNSSNLNQLDCLKLLHWTQELYIRAQSKLLLILHGNLYGTNLVPKQIQIGPRFSLNLIPKLGPNCMKSTYAIGSISPTSIVELSPIVGPITMSIGTAPKWIGPQM